MYLCRFSLYPVASCDWAAGGPGRDARGRATYLIHTTTNTAPDSIGGSIVGIPGLSRCGPSRGRGPYTSAADAAEHTHVADLAPVARSACVAGDTGDAVHAASARPHVGAGGTIHTVSSRTILVASVALPVGCSSTNIGSSRRNTGGSLPSVRRTVVVDAVVGGRVDASAGTTISGHLTAWRRVVGVDEGLLLRRTQVGQILGLAIQPLRIMHTHTDQTGRTNI